VLFRPFLYTAYLSFLGQPKGSLTMAGSSFSLGGLGISVPYSAPFFLKVSGVLPFLHKVMFRRHPRLCLEVLKMWALFPFLSPARLFVPADFLMRTSSSPSQKKKLPATCTKPGPLKQKKIAPRFFFKPFLQPLPLLSPSPSPVPMKRPFVAGRHVKKKFCRLGFRTLFFFFRDPVPPGYPQLLASLQKESYLSPKSSRSAGF